MIGKMIIDYHTYDQNTLMVGKLGWYMFADPRRLSSAKYGSLLCLVRKIFMVALCYCVTVGPRQAIFLWNILFDNVLGLSSIFVTQSI